MNTLSKETKEMDDFVDGINDEVEQKYTGKPHDSLLRGVPITWSSIKEEDNKRDWIWENYIAKGNITLLSALWKAGKTTFLRCMFLAMYNQEELAGQPTYKGRVLVLSEESKFEWSDGRDLYQDDQIDHVYVWSRPLKVKPSVDQWEKIIETVNEICIDKKIDMVVVDTLSTFWPVDNENDSARVMRALVPLYTFTENNIAVLLVHHFRKGGGDFGQASRGSGALPSFVDNIIEFKRNENGFPNQRIITTYGRFDSVLPEVVIEYTDEGKYLTKGEPWQVSKSARLQKLISIFQEAPNPLSTREAHGIWTAGIGAVSLRSLQRYVEELLDQQELVQISEKTVAGKKVPIYGTKGYQLSTHDSPDPYTLRPVVSQDEKDRENDNNTSVVATVAGRGQNRHASHDTTGISVNRADIEDEFDEIFSDIAKK